MKHLVLIFPTDQSANHWMVDRVFRRMGLSRADFTILVWDDRTLVKLNEGHYKCAIVFGEDTLYNVFGKKDIERWFNRVGELKLRDRSIHIVPCFEPRLLLPFQHVKDGEKKDRQMRHPPRYTGAVILAIKKAIRVAESGWSILPTNYLEDPSQSRFSQWVDEFYRECTSDTILSWDIETPYKISEDDEEELDEEKRIVDKTILRISFCYKPGHAVSVPNLPEYRDGIQRMLGYTGMHCGWNIVGFDIPTVESYGWVVKASHVLDGMDGWHLYQSDLDRGLERVSSFYTDLAPWKHLSDAMPALYSCIDADAGLRNTLGVLRDLESIGLRERFFTEMELLQLLREAGERGNLVDEEFRLAFKAELEAKLYTQIIAAQALVPTTFIRHKLMARLPKGAAAEEWATTTIMKTIKCCSLCHKQRVSVKHKCELGEGWEKVPQKIEVPVFYSTVGLNKVTDLDSLQKYLRQEGFNPCSSDQVKKYMRANRHPVGTNHKTKKDTADVKHLQKLRKLYGKNHPIYAATLEIRLIQKALSTYVNGLEPDEHGRIHTTYVNSPSTWRLGSRNINVQNLGKRNNNPYAKKARKIIVPGSDMFIVQADSSAVEAMMVGEFMKDESYKRLASKGVHAYIVGKYLGESLTPLTFTAEDAARLKAAHPALYDQFKQVNHGTNYGMGPYLMHMNDPDKFPTVADAKKIQDFIFSELPSLPTWHHELRLFAKKNGYLSNPWGLRHYFYDVFTYKYDEDGELIIKGGLPQVTLGKDAKRVIAYRPQSSNGMFARDNLLLIGATELRGYIPAVATIHDGYCVEVPHRMIDTAVNILGDILTRPIPQMDGLRVGCEIELFEKNFLESTKIKTLEVAA